jgi:hypothetical protein
MSRRASSPPVRMLRWKTCRYRFWKSSWQELHLTFAMETGRDMWFHRCGTWSRSVFRPPAVMKKQQTMTCTQRCNDADWDLLSTAPATELTYAILLSDKLQRSSSKSVCKCKVMIFSGRHQLFVLDAIRPAVKTKLFQTFALKPSF